MRRGKELQVLIIIAAFILVSVRCFPAEQIIRDTLTSNGLLKTEINYGFKFFRNNSREALKTEYTEYSENRATYNADYFYSINHWNLTEPKHEMINAFLGVGPLYSDGTSIRKETIYKTSFNNRIYGMNLFGEISYSGRFYSGTRSYGLVEVNGFGLFEKIKKRSNGTKADLLSSALPVEVQEEYLDNRFRYGLNTRAGWGIGKPEVVNYRMVAEYILDKYYPEQLFSETEKQKVAGAIGRIKNARSLNNQHNTDKETAQLGHFINSQMLLTIPENLKETWLFGEFSPRYDGSRFDAGPFFNYYNREPDFIYGGFVNYENNKYQNFHWNRYFKTELSYNIYKIRNWFRWETSLAFDYYKNLRSKFSIELKYVPVLVFNSFNDIGPFSHVLIPSLEYYTELNEKLRINVAFSYNLTGDNDFYMKGPEFSLAFYRSRY
jgi:hypothetical protein